MSNERVPWALGNGDPVRDRIEADQREAARDDSDQGSEPQDMTEATQSLLNQALKLSTKERATLAADLLASLDGEPESQELVNAAWSAEIRRRLDDVRAGEPGIPWETVRDEIQARLKEGRGG